MEERISVIMPVYNAALYLSDMLEDLKNQTYQNLEIIIIDDGSTDDSWKTIQKYANEDERIKAISVSNHGPSAARNLGLDMATGEYIRFVDSDDRIPIRSMESMLEPYEKYENIDIVIGNYISAPCKGYFTGDKLETRVFNQKEFSDIFIDYVKSFYIGVPWNKLFRRSIIEQYHIRFNESIVWCEDFLFNVEYFSKIKNGFILNVKNGIYQYCIRDNSITSKLDDKSKEEMAYIEKLRYEAAGKYAELNDKLEKFEWQWSHSGLYEKLSDITKYRSDTFAVRYKKFVNLLQGDSTYHYVCEKAQKTKYREWRMLKKAIERNFYAGIFLYFSVLGILSRFIKPMEVYLNERNTSW